MAAHKSSGISGKFKDLSGRRFGRWSIAADEVPVRRNGKTYWRCRCDCGTEKFVVAYSLTTNATPSTSCGCFAADHRRAGLPANRTHGLSGTRIYGLWLTVIRRCRNPRDKKYRLYGGRGIRVCRRWLDSVEAFVEDMGPRPDGMSIDRINNDGNYSCGQCSECIENGWTANCRWATAAEQNRNYRRNRYIEINGERLLVTDWAAKLGIPAQRIFGRLHAGWEPIRAVLTPFRQSGRSTPTGESRG